MNKKITSIIIMLTLTFTMNSGVIAAPSAGDSASLKQVQDTKKELQTKVQQMDKEIDEVLKKVDSNKKDMEKVAQDIKSTQTKLQDVENSKKGQEEIFKKRLRAMYINGVDSYLGVILASDDLSDFLSRMDTVSKVIQFDKNIVNKLKDQRDSIVKQQENLNSQGDKLSSLKKNNEVTLAKLSKDIKEQKDLLSKATEKEKALVASAEAAKAASNTVIKSGSVSRGATSGSYSKVMNMEATAYCGHAITASGAPTKRNPNGYSTIAVDPRVIPLGTRVFVEGYGYAIAEDTGGAIKGNIIDIFLTSEGECTSWGRRNVTVYILS